MTSGARRASPASSSSSARGQRAVGSRGLKLAARRVGVALFLGVLPALTLAFALTPKFVYGPGWDFRIFYDAARDYLSGVSPYPHATLAAVAGKDVFVYPAPAAAALAPLTLLPFWVAFGIWVAASLAAVMATLWMLGVRDWRCYGAVFLTMPVLNGVRLGTVSPMLMLLLAILWRYRDRWYVAAAATAGMVVLKVFLWPLALWLMFTRRARAAAAALIISLAASVLAWMPLGWSSARAYPDVLSVLSRYEETSSLSMTSLGYLLGLARPTTHALVVVAGAGIVAAGAWLSRRDEFLGFRIVLGGALVLTPILWSHYWMLLLVPLALTHPRLSPRWFAAAWIPPTAPPMAWTANTAVWVAAALATVPSQLGLASRAPFKSERVPRRTRVYAAALAVIALFVGAQATRDFGALRGATLHAVTGSGFAEARFRISPDSDRLCWFLATADVSFPQPPKARLTSGHRGGVAIDSLQMRDDGTSRGCETFGAATRATLRDVVRQTSAYSLEIKTSRGMLRGPLRSSSKSTRG